MRIAFTGAQSTGKTTLLKELKKNNIFQNFVFVDEIVRTIAKQGYKINKEGDDDTQHAIINTHIDNLKYENSILDRCLLDSAVYTNYLFTYQKVGDMTKKKADFALASFADKYDIIFYLSPEFQIVQDGTRSTDSKFRDEIVLGFEHYIKEFDLNVVRLSGSVEERVEQILKVIGDKMSLEKKPEIKIYLEEPSATMPEVAYSGTSACFDLICIKDTVIPARGSAMVPNGVRAIIPQGYYLEFATRSGMGIKQNLMVHPGIINAGYAGPLAVKVFNFSDEEQVIKAGKGCVQVKVHKIPEFALSQATQEEFEQYKNNSERGDRGFGSSDKK